MNDRLTELVIRNGFAIMVAIMFLILLIAGVMDLGKETFDVPRVATERVEKPVLTQKPKDYLVIQERPTEYLGAENIGTTDEEIVCEYCVEETPKYYIQWANKELSNDDVVLLCQTVHLESMGENLEGQYMVALTILNRLLSANYPNTMRGVVYAPGAYAVAQNPNLECTIWSEQTNQAVQMALTQNDYPGNMYFFRTGHFHDFATAYMKLGNHYFSLGE